MKVCQLPLGLDRKTKCEPPLARVLTEVVVVCPFLFNLWELRDRMPTFKYGKGEAIKKRRIMEAHCGFDSDLSRPEWRFTEQRHKDPVDCFTSVQAAENAKPWSSGGSTDAEGHTSAVLDEASPETSGKASPEEQTSDKLTLEK